MKKILAFGASTSKQSINKQLAFFAAGLLDGVELDLIDLNDFDMPVYSIDRENENGIPEAALRFKEHIRNSDGIIISFAEHNGSYTAAFKNIFDWASRVEKSTWDNKPMLLLAASPGGRGAKSVLESAVKRMPFNGGQVIGSYSFPFFKDNFDKKKGITNDELLTELKEVLASFEKAVQIELVEN